MILTHHYLIGVGYKYAWQKNRALLNAQGSRTSMVMEIYDVVATTLDI